MSFIVAGLLTVFSGLLYLSGERIAFGGLCYYTLDLCQHPGWPLALAAAFVAFGLLFRIQQT
jgi:hypothetical protein